MDIYEETAAFYEGFVGEKRVIGESEEGRKLFAVKIGEGEPVGVSQYAIHAREWITARLAFFHAGRGVKGSVWLVPLMDPDGALLVQRGVGAASSARREKLLALSGGDFSLWKANADGVDLNVNFDARWGTGRQNVFSPAAESYVGSRPFSAAETRALGDFTLSLSPSYTVSWHTKGEEIYWRFFQDEERAKRDIRLAKALSRATGYPLREAEGSVGGYKDWCIEKLNIPAFTVEAGKSREPHPLGERALADILKRCGDALTILSGAV